MDRKESLASAIQVALSALGWTPAQAAAALGVPEERLAEALAGDIHWISEWNLEDWLTRLQAEAGLKTEAEAVEAVQQGLRLPCTPGRFRTPDVFLAAVCRRPRHLRFVPESERTPELCFAACRRNGATLEWGPERLCTPGLCLLAVRSHGTALRHVPPESRTEALCREAVRADRKEILHTSLEMVDRTRRSGRRAGTLSPSWHGAHGGRPPSRAGSQRGRRLLMA